jgi:hypothetical protein
MLPGQKLPAIGLKGAAMILSLNRLYNAVLGKTQRVSAPPRLIRFGEELTQSRKHEILREDWQ